MSGAIRHLRPGKQKRYLRCWEMNENPIPNRLINWPIMASVIINFILFISIIRILVQKLHCTDVGGNEQSQYRYIYLKRAFR
ncbi:hypothetical protein NQZ68_027650 [Dissostichus eleginoides]|nr:hypothetical protein NQZ68_027650 [Dissostichus eleginoides]